MDSARTEILSPIPWHAAPPPSVLPPRRRRGRGPDRRARRPRVYTEDRRRKAAALLRRGASVYKAAEAVGVSHETVAAHARQAGLLAVARDARRAAKEARALSAWQASAAWAVIQRVPGLAVDLSGQRPIVTRASDGAPVKLYRPRREWRHRGPGSAAYYRANVGPGVLGVVALPDGDVWTFEPAASPRAIFIPVEVVRRSTVPRLRRPDVRRVAG